MTLRDPHIASRCVETKTLIAQASRWALYDPALGAHLAAYLTVLITGLVEESIERLVRRRVEIIGDPEIVNFVSNAIDRQFRNPDYSTISGLLRQFSDMYQNSFRTKIPHDSSEAVALNSIIGNKNSLAHTGTAKLSLTVSDLDGLRYGELLRSCGADIGSY